MKKTIVYLGVALVAFANVSLASNFNPLPDGKIIVSYYEGISPLCTAISKGEVEVVKKLIEYGANINEKSNGMSPLMFAARYNKVAIIKILLANGANPKVKDFKGFTALKHAEISNATDAAMLLKQA
ncbi:ankyrin repeat domain-containing protein [Flavobacterium cellulosilyticum]|uniref:Ankyrin repeat domain-containing protein n=1 Tax=Flavobacterium cellulosilyticum TaxID=2541731 RepID=A0A4R5C5B8_9FLAO|nr:ankyrin repeat domain-containing protein [Flavobacterium cellulosilyticum]TDD93676.1 ankyrin repeat domain-containing protein [Flavobacterium cellulosilyticum]